MRSRMSAQQLAKLKGKATDANQLNQLATAANGSGVTRVEQRKADAELQRQVGPRRARQLKESALQRAGAKPKGFRRLLG